MVKTLFDDVRSEQNLFSAWRHVRRSALNSSNNEIKGFAAEFEFQHQRHLKRIAQQLRKNTFEFDEVKGILKDKKKRLAQGKDPRPIAIATVKDRVVQRAILQILQPRRALDQKSVEPKYVPFDDPRLGKLNLVNRSRYGVGGLLAPFGGVRPAIELVMCAMDAGARYYFQSDIKAFFTKIPTKSVIDTIQAETGDVRLASLFAKGLAVNLANKSELLTYARLFPSAGIGVAQGSSLSTFAGNVLLYDFDHELNSSDVTAVRYIDDLLIVSTSASSLERAIKTSELRLGSFRFSLYKPVPGSEKASQGKCEDAFKFLGCTLQPNRCVPSKQSIDKLTKEVSELLSASKSNIKKLLSDGKALDPNQSRSVVLHALGKKIFGWQKSFAFCTDSNEFRRLDDAVSIKVTDYEAWIRDRMKQASSDQLMQVLGIPSTEAMFQKDKARNAA